jgi:iron complex outermembrane receptor protein
MAIGGEHQGGHMREVGKGGLKRIRIAALAGAIALAATPAIGMAQARSYNIEAKSLSQALKEFGRASGHHLLFQESLVRGKTSVGLKGSYDTDAALARLLEGTGLQAQRTANGSIVIRPAVAAPGEGPAGSTAADIEDSEIVVTGSRIKGAVTSSPVFTYDTRKMRDEGITDMRSLAAAIPQNFTGGQNPGVGAGGESRGNENGNSSTGLNLRGLGPGATLTLLNGRRLAYNQNNNSVDFSSIPFAAVDRVEVMPDGASAIYGSDAVGGVANIILKKDFEGLWTNMVIGGATDGGYLTQSMSTVAGTKWGGGGIMLTGNYDRSTGITAGQRSFASTSNPDLSLYPDMTSYGFVGSVHQDVGERISLSLDALFHNRDASRQATYTAAAPARQSGLVRDSSSWSLNLAPSATVHLGRWDVTLSGVYGRTGTDLDNSYFPSRTVLSSSFRNETKTADISAEGPLFALPAGDVRLAVGGGFRRDKLTSLTASTVRGHQSAYSAYGELNVPLASPGQEIWGAYRANLDLAVRYEDYPGAGRLATPKVGLSWSPTPDFEMKGSWGKSFRVPSLFQRLYEPYILLYPSDFYGSRPAPAGETILVLGAGNDELKPEKADTLSGTFILHPRAISGLNIAVTYFDVDYRSRIAYPMTSVLAAIDNPLYAGFIQYNPSAAAIAAAIAKAPQGIDDQTGSGLPFDPASVYAIIDNRYRNVSRERVHGLDFTLHYSLDTGAGKFALQAGGTYLESTRVVVAGQTSIDLAGTVFNPPHFKLRGGLAWTSGPFSLNSVVTRIGGVKDDRLATVVKVDGTTTVDLSLKRRFGGEKGFDLQLSGLNLLNAKPDVIRGTGVNQPFDSTNYSAIGRYLSFSITGNF